MRRRFVRQKRKRQRWKWVVVGVLLKVVDVRLLLRAGVDEFLLMAVVLKVLLKVVVAEEQEAVHDL